VLCASGRFSAQNGISIDLNKNKEDGTICEACPTGRYSNALGQVKESACKFCTAGKYSNEPASNKETNCKTCIAGKYYDDVGAESEAKCKTCPLGYVQPSVGKAFCLPCVPGKYRNQEEQQTCIECEVGQASEEVARNRTCDFCTKGRYQPKEGTTSCLDCIPGRYQSQEEQQTCKECQVGQA
jgi:hypothetical protein